MNQQTIINELKTIIAHSEVVKEKSYRLLQKLEGVSTSSNTRKGIIKSHVADAVAKRRKTMLK